MAAYMVFFPRARVLTAVPIFFFIRIVHLPAGFFIGLWFVLQLLYAFLGGSARAWPSSPTWAGSSSGGW